ncbi:MAG: sirohydrochlorin chelatase [Jatrophihabitans sp.]
MHDTAPRLLAVAHGTASVPGRTTIDQLLAAVAAARPSVHVELCFLDVLDPRLPGALDDTTPTVVVPLLLSTGYHVQSDIPAAVALYPRTSVARHLGPHPLIVDALLERLGAVGADDSVVLVGAGSSRSQGTDELARTAELLGEQLDRPVAIATMAADLTRVLGGPPAPVRVATYLLAEGRFVTTLRTAARDVGATVSGPLGAHPAIVELVCTRYDEAVASVR